MEAAFSREATLERYGHTLSDPKRLLYRGTVCHPSYGFSVFASDVVLDYIRDTQNPLHYHIDGTFGVVPRGEFRQLLIIHLAIQNHVCLTISLSSMSTNTNTTKLLLILLLILILRILLLQNTCTEHPVPVHPRFTPYENFVFGDPALH